MSTLQVLRGMHDLLPGQSSGQRWIEKQLIATADKYGFLEIRTPLIERLDVFVRSIGEVTDIVEKEMYVFPDRNEGGKGDKKTALRPEYTAGCVRALLEHGLIRQEQKLWYLGPMFRYERPQAGRYRQFSQFGMEHFGGVAPWADISLLAITNRMWKQLGIKPQLEINSIGKLEERRAYNKTLVSFLEQHHQQLDADSQRRLPTNPLRILDSKDPDTMVLLDSAPRLLDYLGQESREIFSRIQQGLDALNIPWRYNPRLVRGLDYYNDLVFEWTTDKLGSQSTICAGGRYDGLAQQLGNKQQVPAIGFALGVDRLALLLQQSGLVPKVASCDIFMVCTLEPVQALVVHERIQQYLPRMRVGSDISGSSMKSQFKKANKSEASWALIVGQDERDTDSVSIKNLREKEEQLCVPMNQIAQFFEQQLETEQGV